MPLKQSKTCLSSSGRVETITNYVAFFDKQSVHTDFHPLVDFLKNSPVSYALTATPTIYAEIVQEMWSKADCTTNGEIKFTIKGNSYIATPSVINEALHLPVSNFENLPTDDEIISMLKFIKYAWRPWQLNHIQTQISTLYTSHSHTTSSLLNNTKDHIPSTKVTVPSQSPPRKEATFSVYGKRKTMGTSEENEEETEVNPPKKKMEASVIKPQTGLLDVDPQMSPGCSGDAILVAGYPSSPEKEKPKCNLRFVLEHTLEPDSPEEDILQDR
ncbi:hypothetical protein POM88_034479 [Heracleum sosnowskyi]|uniref:Uncharacterized protein n=1 Tax=Heracleum sosnowskyi TaxID=360622 RepID=A0AAD8MD12_9APIA|nr:hypothetical protein POM88_034479 [Heracleum sosnowskyi]